MYLHAQALDLLLPGGQSLSFCSPNPFEGLLDYKATEQVRGAGEQAKEQGAQECSVGVLPVCLVDGKPLALLFAQPRLKYGVDSPRAPSSKPSSSDGRCAQAPPHPGQRARAGPDPPLRVLQRAGTQWGPAWAWACSKRGDADASHAAARALRAFRFLNL